MTTLPFIVVGSFTTDGEPSAFATRADAVAHSRAMRALFGGRYPVRAA